MKYCPLSSSHPPLSPPSLSAQLTHVEFLMKNSAANQIFSQHVKAEFTEEVRGYPGGVWGVLNPAQQFRRVYIPLINPADTYR